MSHTLIVPSSLEEHIHLLSIWNDKDVTLLVCPSNVVTALGFVDRIS